MRLLGLSLLFGCGRIGFAPTGPGDGGTADSSDALVLPASDIVFRFQFEGVTADDITGATPGCDPQCPTFTSGHTGMAARFANNQCLSFGDDPSYHLSSLTFSMWMWLDAVQFTTLVSNDVVPSDHTWEVWVGNNGFPRFSLFDATGQVNLACSGAYQTNTWQHLAATFDGATQRIYLDGHECGSRAVGALVYVGMAPIHIGCAFENGATTAFVQGGIDDLILIDRVLTEAEIAALP